MITVMGDLPNQIADIVHEEYDKLPRKSKPGASADGIHDWVPLAGIVAIRGELRKAYESLCTRRRLLIEFSPENQGIRCLSLA